METRRALLIDAFTREPLTGNAAGLLPDAAGLQTDQLQAIARELQVSETAFLFPSDDADRRIRYFTPTQEVDLCGHATIAAHAFLSEAGDITAGSHTLETNLGVLDIEVTADTVWMSQESASVHEVDLEYGRIADALGVDPATLIDVGADLPLMTASTGLPYLIVPVNFLEAVSGLTPDAEAVAALTNELDVVGVYAFTFDTIESDATLHGRMFAPQVGITEDPVTGTAAGATAAYLRETQAFDGDFPSEMVFEQGHFIDRPGRVRVRARSDPIEVGGWGITTLDGSITVPAPSRDEIIEV